MSNKANKYISKGGRVSGYNKDDYIDDIIAVSSFLAWAEDEGLMFAGVHAKDAFKSFCRITDVDSVGLRKISKGGLNG